MMRGLINDNRAMTRDESIYKEPNEFRPERFFNADGTLNDDDTVLAYGFGRRYFRFSAIDTPSNSDILIGCVWGVTWQAHL